MVTVTATSYTTHKHFPDNSHLFDFSQSWFYVFGVGVAAASDCVSENPVRVSVWSTATNQVSHFWRSY
jgi:hypothetical protein